MLESDGPELKVRWARGMGFWVEVTACETQTGDRPQLIWEATGVEQKRGEQVGIRST